MHFRRHHLDSTACANCKHNGRERESGNPLKLVFAKRGGVAEVRRRNLCAAREYSVERSPHPGAALLQEPADVRGVFCAHCHHEPSAARKLLPLLLGRGEGRSEESLLSPAGFMGRGFLDCILTAEEAESRTIFRGNVRLVASAATLFRMPLACGKGHDTEGLTSAWLFWHSLGACKRHLRTAQPNETTFCRVQSWRLASMSRICPVRAPSTQAFSGTRS